jgi:asparagine synthase (glutamine-hydrolysing)
VLRAFAAIYDPSSRDPQGDRRRVVAGLGDADGDIASGSLVLAWRGGAAPYEPRGDDEPGERRPLVFLDGTLYESVRAERGGHGPGAILSARFAREGTSLFASLRGDFVVVVHEADRDELTVARDHMGGRGLFWHASGDRVCVASEVRYLLALLPTVPEPDVVALAHVLGPSGQPVDRSVYADVHRLPGGQVLRCHQGGQSLARYWELRYRRPEPLSRAEHVAGLRDVLATAVRRRCFGPQTGIMLSGGLDSATVAGLASRMATARRPCRAYSATFPDHPTVDEGGLIRRLCETLGLAGTRILVHRGSVAAGALEYIEHWRLPPPSPNLFFWLPLLRRAAADGIDGLVDGEGGDELFGLSAYLVADLVRRGRFRSAREAVRNFPGGGPHITRAASKPFLVRFGLKGAAPAWLEAAVRRRRGGATYTPPWLRPAMVEAFMDGDTSADWKRLPGPRWWASLVDIVTRGSGAAMTYDHVRRRAALCGIEQRHPLVDVDVIEYMLAVPPELSYDTRFSRPLIREAMAGCLPDEVRLRPTKSTFDAVFHQAVAGPDLGVARRLLRPGHALVEAYVDLGVVARELLDDPPPPDQRLEWSQFVWRLVTAELWLRVRAGEPVGVSFAPADIELVGP